MAYGVKISKSGYDVKDTDLENLILSSGKNLHKIKSEGDFNAIIPANQINVTVTISHNLGYFACFIVYMDTRDGSNDPIAGKRERLNAYWGITGIAEARMFINDLKIYVSAWPSVAYSRTFSGHYFIFHDPLPT